MPDLSIIIVNWNSMEYVRQCLRSLFKHSVQTSTEVIVVDGASFDGCGEMLAREFPTVIFVQGMENLGFAKANNLGAKYARGGNLLFLNPDTELIEDSVSVLLGHLATLPDAGAVGCRLLNSDRSVQTSCIQSYPTFLNQVLDSEFLRRLLPKSPLWGMKALYMVNPLPSEVEVISGACILIKRTVFEDVGGFSEIYFMYAEDLDLCCKIQRADFRTYYVPATSIVHHGGGSSRESVNSFSSVMMRESVFRFLKTNRGLTSALLYRAGMMASSCGRMLLIVPLLLISSKRVPRHGAYSVQKWKAILRWSCGMKPPLPQASQ
jgi:GT2 family glycosyltransferase